MATSPPPYNGPVPDNHGVMPLPIPAQSPPIFEKGTPQPQLQQQQQYQYQTQPVQMQPMNAQLAQVTPLHMLDKHHPQSIDCQSCHRRTQTRVDSEGTGLQVITGALLCFVCICLAPLPCMLHWFEETRWYCNGCNTAVAWTKGDMPVQVIQPPAMQSQQNFGVQSPMQSPGPQSPYKGPQENVNPMSYPGSPQPMPNMDPMSYPTSPQPVQFQQGQQQQQGYMPAQGQQPQQQGYMPAQG